MNSITKAVCATCKRELDVKGDPLSSDCGGDCWGCVGEAEANLGYQPSIIQCNEEIEAGYRSGPKFELRKDVGHGQE